MLCAAHKNQHAGCRRSPSNDLKLMRPCSAETQLFCPLNPFSRLSISSPVEVNTAVSKTSDCEAKSSPEETLWPSFRHSTLLITPTEVHLHCQCKSKHEAHQIFAAHETGIPRQPGILQRTSSPARRQTAATVLNCLGRKWKTPQNTT